MIHKEAGNTEIKVVIFGLVVSMCKVGCVLNIVLGIEDAWSFRKVEISINICEVYNLRRKRTFNRSLSIEQRIAIQFSWKFKYVS